MMMKIKSSLPVNELATGTPHYRFQC